MTECDIEPIEWKIERWKLKDLKGFPNNPRVLSKHMYRELKKSLEQDGNHGVLKLNADGTIIGGNQRAKLLRDLGEKEVDVKVSTRQLTDEEALRINLRDNKVQADFDIDMLANYYDPNVLVDSGFTPEEMGGFNPTVVEEIESEEGEDDAPEPPKEPETKKGDVYEFGEHRLVCGDSVAITDVEKLLDGRSVELVYTDPPYGADIVNSNGKLGGDKPFGNIGNMEGKAVKAGSYAPIIGDKNTDTAVESFNLSIALCKNLIFWGAQYYADKLPPSSGWIVWDKDTDGSLGDGELAYTTQKRAIRIYQHKWSGMIKASEHGQRRVHSTQKPIALAVWCFENYAKDAVNVLDLFGGSGSTLMACEQTKRKCFMMELSPNYCDVIVKRWVEFRKKNGQDCVVKRNGLEIDSEIFNKANKKRT